MYPEQPDDRLSDAAHPRPRGRTHSDPVRSLPTLSLECRRIQADLSAYLDEDLTVDRRRAIAHHVERCVLCRSELALLHDVERVLVASRLELPEVGDLRQGFYARLAADNERRRLRWDWRLLIPTLAAASLMVGVFQFQYRWHRQNVRAVNISSPVGSDALLAGNGHVDGQSDKPAPSIRQKIDDPTVRIAANIALKQTHRGRMTAKLSQRSHGARIQRGIERSDRSYHHLQMAKSVDANPSTYLYSPVSSLAWSSTANDSTADVAASNSSTSTFAYEKVYDRGDTSVNMGNYAFGRDGGHDDEDGVCIQVRDSLRGFTASTRVVSSVEQRGATRILRLEVEDGESTIPTGSQTDGEQKLEKKER